MTCTLYATGTAGVLARLHRFADCDDGAARRRVRWREASLERELESDERAALLHGAPGTVTREAGALLYALALTRGGLAVEFGAGLGVSTIYLAAAAQDAGAGAGVITTEFVTEKAELARHHLAEAGLGELVEVRVGDALTTLCGLPAAVELLFLDGGRDSYLPLLRFLEPRLGPGALVIAALSASHPALEDYRAYVRGENGYASVCVGIDAGVEVSLWKG